MNTSEFGNVSWIYYVIGAYLLVGLSIVVFAIMSLRRFRSVRNLLKEEGFLEKK